MYFEIEKLVSKLDNSNASGFEIERIASAMGATTAGFEDDFIGEKG